MIPNGEPVAKTGETERNFGIRRRTLLKRLIHLGTFPEGFNNPELRGEQDLSCERFWP